MARGKYLGIFAASVASNVVNQVPDNMFGKLVVRRLSTVLPEYLAEVGVTAVVIEGFAGEDQSGKTILRCDVTDVDPDLFLPAAGAGGTALGAIARGEHMWKLGHRARSGVYQAVRKYISTQ